MADKYRTVMVRCFTCFGSKAVRGRPCPRCGGKGKIARKEKVFDFPGSRP